MEYTPDQINLMLTEIQESRKALRKLRRLCRAAERKLEKSLEDYEAGGGFLGDILDDAVGRLSEINQSFPAEPETK